MRSDAPITNLYRSDTGPHLPLAENVAPVKPRAFHGRSDTLRQSGLEPLEVTS